MNSDSTIVWGTTIVPGGGETIVSGATGVPGTTIVSGRPSLLIGVG